MNLPLPVHRIVEEWLLWATWQSDSTNSGKQNDDLIGFDEFDWVVRSHPEHAWECILATVKDSRSKPFLGLLAAGPMEDLLSFHGPVFIERVENEAKINPAFASSWAVFGVFKCLSIFGRVYKLSGIVVAGTGIQSKYSERYSVISRFHWISTDYQRSTPNIQNHWAVESEIFWKARGDNL
jgi:hypothetical protein